jgi:hypothetical protein
MRIAELQAEEVRSEARAFERETRGGAEMYADEVFSHVEQSLENVLSQVRRVHDRLNTNSAPDQNGQY